jgi:signal transduction histidine kinase
MQTPPEQIERTQIAFTRRVLGLVGLGFLAVIAAGIAVAWLQAQNVANGRWVQHTLDTQAKIGEYSSLNERAETARRGLLISHDPRFRVPMDKAATDAGALLDQLGILTMDNPTQRQRVVALRGLLARQREQQRLTSERPEALPTLDYDHDPALLLTRRARDIANAMFTEEQRLLGVRSAEQHDTLQVFYTILIAAGVLLVVVASITILIMLRYTRELAGSRAQLRLLNDDLEDLVEARTSELQRANQEIQRFAYIVSHDLRSPLVNVMGFTAELDAARKIVATFIDNLAETQPDLVEQPIRLAVDEDLPEAIGFIRTSTQKMDRLINAILRLSREGRRTLTPERIDVDALVQSILDSIQHRVAETGTQVSADPLPEITTDRFSLEQILSNLVENAIKYLQAGRPGIIRVTGGRDRDRLFYEVTDNGRGIDPRDHERIFDLFRRSGVQDQPGEGIGLAHVRALAYRLGGIIEVRSELDRGSTFRLSLPAIYKVGENKE